MATVQRKQAPRLARPAARYWKGKAPKGIVEAASDSEVDEEAEDEREVQEDGDVQIRDAGDIDMGGSGEEEEMQIPKARVGVKGKSISVALKDVSVSKEGKVIVAGRLESGKTEMEGEEGGMFGFCLRVLCVGCSIMLLDLESSEEESEEEEGLPGKEESDEEVGSLGLFQDVIKVADSRVNMRATRKMKPLSLYSGPYSYRSMHPLPLTYRMNLTLYTQACSWDNSGERCPCRRLRRTTTQERTGS